MLKYSIIAWEEKTVGEKNVEFVILDDSQKIYCEVKSPGWEGELTDEERQRLMGQVEVLLRKGLVTEKELLEDLGKALNRLETRQPE